MIGSPAARPASRPGRGFLAGWTLRCAAAEAIGMTAAAAAAKFAQAATGDSASSRLAALALVVGGGLVEGTALGALQAAGLARALPGLDRRRWLRVTVAVAGLGWALASAGPVLAGDDAGAAGPPLWVSAGGGAGLGVAMGALLGAAQAWCLRGRVARPYRWVAVNAAGWCPAMAIVFTGASSPGSDWAVWQVSALGTLTGLAAGTVLGLLTGILFPTLGIPEPLPAAAVRQPRPV